jgi:NAD(P)-dependent dehydrogenase (short-subunit alcohol dehydrogenase family)
MAHAWLSLSLVSGIVKAVNFLDMSEEDFDDVIAVNLK